MDASDIDADAAVIRDPVCGMTVDPAAGKPRHALDGRTYHFCCEGCRTKFAAAPEDYRQATDPVCGMSVDRATASHTARHGGERFYFCSAGCQDRFEAAPDDFLGDRPAPAPMPEGTVYTCPMHPEIEQVGPGRLPDLRHGARAQGRALRRRGAQSRARRLPPPLRGRRGADTAPCGDRHGADARPAGRATGSARATARWIELVLATPVVLWSGWPFLVRGWRSFRTMNLNMFTLIAIGVTARLRLQRRRGRSRRACSRPASATTPARSGSISRRRR